MHIAYIELRGSGTKITKPYERVEVRDGVIILATDKTWVIYPLDRINSAWAVEQPNG